jgi:hypothetical protein
MNFNISKDWEPVGENDELFRCYQKRFQSDSTVNLGYEDLRAIGIDVSLYEDTKMLAEAFIDDNGRAVVMCIVTIYENSGDVDGMPLPPIYLVSKKKQMTLNPEKGPVFLEVN